MRIPYKKIKDDVLGKQYDLSLAFLSAREMRTVTMRSKGVDKVSNVLSFPLSKASGEILICRRAAPPFTVGYLFIHGLFHLKGMRHGATMEREERKTLQRFGLRMHVKNSYRN